MRATRFLEARLQVERSWSSDVILRRACEPRDLAPDHEIPRSAQDDTLNCKRPTPDGDAFGARYESYLSRPDEKPERTEVAIRLAG